MKIYTEVNYTWVDDRLVETSSKSFDYTGNLDLCGGGGGGGGKGGGGGGGGGTLGSIVSSTTEQVSNVVTDPVGTVQDSLSPITDPIQEQIVDPLMENFVEDPMEDVTEAIAETGGVEEEEEIDTATGKGTSDRLKGVGASLAIKKKSEGQGGKFTRGSLRVRRPTSTMKA